MDLKLDLDIRPQDRKILSELLADYLPAGTKVLAFGSRVKGTARPASDLDLVVFTSSPGVSDLREAFEESNLPFRVDLHVWDELPEAFHGQIESQYVEFLSA
ncbi:MAG: nucleotidyltransferase family protein [Fimbriimonas sp.]